MGMNGGENIMVLFNIDLDVFGVSLLSLLSGCDCYRCCQVVRFAVLGLDCRQVGWPERSDGPDGQRSVGIAGSVGVGHHNLTSSHPDNYQGPELLG